ncbi:ATP-binding cassette domain-containing protein [Entomospira culicis]|uniref:ATP-binding cassette domain-containing protein n=1 Tax=Entomospira culicis TaxID=2719989 RepID=A0A968GJP7_9SPIO|nr:ATP-binding cassette domain-containing protein [Entomospira culicis]NIZ18885.1 ATP-binding cassette domain-containing protein [Entomospira culicis]NIZ69100.1 ATP-binding cassette domain-containing protein [Entomospira culicis]WDI37687.1 ATP-binding cassette domain-containing protein [Entomospira culicis]WDI39315.1 ATP-binding cassette domain-containing protein [Entomospira culicis]
MSILVEAKNLSFGYAEKTILERVHFQQKRGESIAFVGLSGGGKTTLLKLIAGILSPTAGDLSVHTKRVAYVSQSDGLLPWLTVLENILLREILHGEAKNEAQARQILAQVGLSGYEGHFPYQLSGGMKKRVELARALLHQPELLLLDEPFSALDLYHREKLQELTQRMCAELGTSLILVSHSLDEAWLLADRIFGLMGAPASIGLVGKGDKQQSVEPSLINPAQSKEQMHRFLYEEAERLQVGFEVTPRLVRGFSIHNYIIPTLIIITLLTGVVSLLKYTLGWPDYLLPYPNAVINIWWQTMRSGLIGEHLWVTSQAALLGFGLALFVALPLGYLFSRSRLLHNYGMPVVLMANTIPTVAIAPFIVLWFGFGLFARVLTVFLIVWLPMLMGSYQAFKISMGQVREHKSFFRPKWYRSLRFLELPATLAHLFSSIKVSLTLSIMGAVVGEFIAGSKGLGALLNIAKANYNMPLMFTALLWLMTLGLLSYAGVSIVERFLLRRHWGYLHISHK